jgi:hypothetical protein
MAIAVFRSAREAVQSCPPKRELTSSMSMIFKILITKSDLTDSFVMIVSAIAGVTGIPNGDVRSMNSQPVKR